MKKILFFILMLMIPFFVNAEEAQLEWIKSWGGSSDDSFTDTLLLEDGSFISIGQTFSSDIDGIVDYNYTDAIIVKYDKDGNLLWQKSWRGDSDDYFLNILQFDDGFVLTGHSYSDDMNGMSNKGKSDAIIVKYNND